MWLTLNFYLNTVEMPVESAIYREGIIGQPIAINPVIAGTNDVDRDLIGLLFSDLLDLIENHKVDKDGQLWRLTLKPDLRWSDGKPLTSDDIIFTIDAIQNSESRSPIFLSWQGIVVDRLSERELEFTLRTPYAFFLDNLRDLKIIPKHIFDVIPIENFRLSNFNLEPVGSGPYKFSSLEKRPDGFITDYHLEINENYPLKKPYLEKLDIKFYQNNDELIKSFNHKKIDGFGGLNPKNIKDLKLEHAILEKIIPRYYAIFLNKNAGASLEDSKVLTALNLATNKLKIVDRVFENKALVVNGPLLPVIDGYDKSAEPNFDFSIGKAKEILDKAGWIPDKETGIRSKKIGKKTESLEYAIVVPQIPFLAETADILKEDWGGIGVQLNLILLNPNDIINEVIKTRNYQIIIFGNILKNSSDIFSFWHSSERFYPGLNLALYNNKKIDALLESIRKNFDDQSRKKNLAKLQKLINEDQPAIFLYSPTYLYVTQKDFGGFDDPIINTPSDRFKKVNEWYLETKRIFK